MDFRRLLYGTVVLYLIFIVSARGQNVRTNSDKQVSIDTTLILKTAKKNKLSPFPIVNFTPETNLVIGISGLYTFYFDKKDTTGRPSFIFGTGIYTLKKQVISALYLNTWSKKNKLHNVFNLSYTRFNYSYFGIGNRTRLENEQKLKENKTELSYAFEHKLPLKFYGGLEFYYRYEDFKPASVFDTLDKRIPGYDGGTIVTFGGSLIYDTRDFFTSTTTGSYYKVSYLPTVNIFGNFYDNYKIIFESRNFYTLKEKHTIGINTNIETIQGESPFFDLRQLGSSFMMRGYFAGRYRDHNYSAAQVEYRFAFAKRWRVAGFLGTGQVFDNSYFALKEFKPNFGVGMRFVLDKASRINLRVDYGFGEKVSGEERIQGLYFFLGEAF